MEFSLVKNSVKHRKSSSVRTDEGGREQPYNKKVKANADKEQIGGEEWKVIITLGNETGHSTRFGFPNQWRRKLERLSLLSC